MTPIHTGRPSGVDDTWATRTSTLSADHRLAYVFGSLVVHRRLILQMTRREIVGRYRGSSADLL